MTVEIFKLSNSTMSKKLEKIFLNGFKSYNERQDINLSDINILMGANSSGKSSSIQSLSSSFF